MKRRKVLEIITHRQTDYADASLDCGHSVTAQMVRRDRSGNPVWPKTVRCWKCEKAVKA